MKTPLVLTLMAALAVSNAAEPPEASAAELERGYAGHAQQLRAELAAALRDKQVRDQVLRPLWEVDERLQRLSTGPGKPSDMPSAFEIVSFSTALSMLKRDPKDVWQRFHTEVRFQVRCLDKTGRPMKGSKPWNVSMPAVARANGEWLFPDANMALGGITFECQKVADKLMEAAEKLAIAHSKGNRK